MHEQGAEMRLVFLCVKYNLIISYVIIAYPLPVVCQDKSYNISHFIRVCCKRATPQHIAGGPTPQG